MAVVGVPFGLSALGTKAIQAQASRAREKAYNLDVILPDFGCDMMEESTHSARKFKTKGRNYLG